MAQGFGPDDLISCYRRGVFPMSDRREDEFFYLVEPKQRGILPLRSFHISKSMKKFRKKTSLKVTFNQDFAGVIKACATNHDGTWISHAIEGLYRVLHQRGDAHSIEVWEEDTLVGGLYGVTQGRAFFGESMFSTRTNASKLALIHLVEHLIFRGFILLDTQFLTEHLKSLGAIEIPQTEYLEKLNKALESDARFD
ncbi:MAG: leucyl/phenylalanyl-tRNA--protein transferase [Litorimonas sp.]